MLNNKKIQIKKSTKRKKTKVRPNQKLFREIRVKNSSQLPFCSKIIRVYPEITLNIY